MQNATVLGIEFPKIEILKEHPANSRNHSDDQLEQIGNSMLEFGWTRPVVVDEDYTILAGHGAIRAARRLYEQDKQIHDVPIGTAPVVVKKGLDDTQKRALIIADNRLALNSSWDEQVLADELNSLVQSNFNVNLLGFNNTELESLLLDEMDEPTGEGDPIGAEIEDVPDQYLVLVELQSESEQVLLLNELLGKGYACKALTS